ncbi:TIGR04372 family glycosyltransferase [Leptospira sp. GIMC2001]|uniref:TIGR04372 family glycosyltransferase n=1 Tax=Leptospira sp. GIMC2001 TaxID=1513297 RepID=UPI00234BD122|nr:TIGR04372 family glycosyltransferase [Leptospira sp. GIMC2001]WCL51218.1 TIGR04372 family glycosyltransferase [Leptospira sp. GIMC2001]
MNSKIKKLIRLIILSPLYFLSLIFILITRFLKPWIVIRFGSLNSEIIGGFVPKLDIYFSELRIGINATKAKNFNIWFFDKIISNSQIAKMVKRSVFTLPYWLARPLLFCNELIPRGSDHIIPKHNSRDVNSVFDRFPPYFKFLEEEEKKGELELKRLGIPQDSKFVCILARDSAYKQQIDSNKDWSYHNFRNTDVKKYMLTAEELSKRGYYVLRMGKFVADKFDSNDPKIIDYASSNFRSDFMDVYLGAKCEFAISMGSGWDTIPFIFRKPIIFVNFIPVGYLWTFSDKYLTIVKHHIDKDGNPISLKNLFENEIAYFMYSQQFEDLGIRVIENTPEEILSVVIEFLKRKEGSLEIDEKDELLQEKFWGIFNQYVKNKFPSGNIHGENKARFGMDFLRNNPAWLD